MNYIYNNQIYLFKINAGLVIYLNVFLNAKILPYVSETIIHYTFKGYFPVECV